MKYNVKFKLFKLCSVFTFVCRPHTRWNNPHFLNMYALFEVTIVKFLSGFMIFLHYKNILYLVKFNISEMHEQRNSLKLIFLNINSIWTTNRLCSFGD